MFNDFKESGFISFFFKMSFLLSFEKAAEVMYYMPLWERINLGLECIGIVVLIGLK